MRNNHIHHEWRENATGRASRNLTSAIVTHPCFYDGQPKTPSPVVMWKGRMLDEGTDYEVTFANNVDAGVGKATIEGKGQYGGSVVVSFTIHPRHFANCEVTVVPSRLRKGEAHAPSVTVTDRGLGTTLVAGRDYEVAHTRAADGGVVSTTVYGKGNYTSLAIASTGNR